LDKRHIAALLLRYLILLRLWGNLPLLGYLIRLLLKSALMQQLLPAQAANGWRHRSWHQTTCDREELRWRHGRLLLGLRNGHPADLLAGIIKRGDLGRHRSAPKSRGGEDGLADATGRLLVWGERPRPCTKPLAHLSVGPLDCTQMGTPLGGHVAIICLRLGLRLPGSGPERWPHLLRATLLTTLGGLSTSSLLGQLAVLLTGLRSLEPVQLRSGAEPHLLLKHGDRPR
jgi:hypothetical protein